MYLQPSFHICVYVVSKRGMPCLSIIMTLAIQPCQHSPSVYFGALYMGYQASGVVVGQTTPKSAAAQHTHNGPQIQGTEPATTPRLRTLMAALKPRSDALACFGNLDGLA